MAKRRVRAEPDVATPEEVLRTFTQIMRGEMTESTGRKGPEGEEVCLPPKVSERSRAAHQKLKRLLIHAQAPWPAWPPRSARLLPSGVRPYPAR